MTHADLAKRVKELLGRGVIDASTLVLRLNNAFVATDLAERIQTLDDIESLSPAAIEAALARLSHAAYDRNDDHASRAADTLREAS